jgi:hypothetical protein
VFWLGLMMLALILALLIVCALAVVLWLRARTRMRQQAIRRYSDEQGFAYLGSQLPPMLDMSRSSMRQMKSLSNAFTGSRSGKQFVFFDCRIPEGRTGYAQSVLAIHGLKESYAACRWDRALRQERLGEWSLIFHDRRLWPVSEIDAHVSTL